MALEVCSSQQKGGWKLRMPLVGMTIGKECSLLPSPLLAGYHVDGHRDGSDCLGHAVKCDVESI